jgi:hypothetical protein
MVKIRAQIADAVRPSTQLEAVPKRVIPTGIDVLDGLLPYGGLVRGHLTEMAGARGTGRTSFMLGVIAQLAARGERSVIVDIEGDLDPYTFTAAGIPSELVWAVFPKRRQEGLWAADLLIRSGHFGLVVLDGLSATVRTASLVRLQRQAREVEAVLLVGSNGSPVSAPGSLQLCFRSLGVEWEERFGRRLAPRRARFAVCIAKQRREVSFSVPCRSRRLLGCHAEGPDRRPAKWTLDR